MEKEIFDSAEMAADEQFQAFVLGEDPKAVAYWQDWLRAHPEAAEEVEKAAYLVRALSMGLDREAVAKRKKELLRSVGQQASSGAVVRRMPPRYRWAMTAAAAVVLLVGVWIGLGEYLSAPLTGKNGAKWVEKRNPAGVKLSFSLPDGTLVKLNSESTLKFAEAFDSGTREVHLEGEAFFDVVSDPARPFVIKTELAKVSVLGTAFNVNAYEGQDSVQVAVLHGRVALASALANAEPVVLEAGKSGTATAKNGQFRSIKVREVHQPSVFDWKDGVLTFNNADLTEVSETIGRWYGVETRVEVVSPEGFAINGRFDNEPLGRVLAGIAMAARVKYRKEGNTIIFY